MVDVYLLVFVYADLDRRFIDNVDLDGEEKQGGFDEGFIRSLRNAAENEGVSDIGLASARLALNFLELSSEILDLCGLLL